jgi:hypothetical protein
LDSAKQFCLTIPYNELKNNTVVNQIKRNGPGGI